MTDKPPAPDNNEPDWSLLPRDPVKFFALPEEWTENDLKVSYSSLIRKFKPDRAPDEFQKIRRAYETLKARLEQGSGATYTFQMSTSEDYESGSSGSWPDERWGILESPEPIVIGIDPSEPEESFRQLLAKPTKSADDFVDLAILSDIVGHESFPDRGSFESWLWDGLKTYPRSRPLMEILAAHYNDPTNKTLDFEAAIKRVVALRPHAVSHELLSGLIFGIVKKKGIKRCLELWDSELQPHAEGRSEVMSVLVDLLPTAAWFQEDAWVARQMKLLESDNNWQRIDFEGLERALHVVTLARQGKTTSDHETALAGKIREICQKVLTIPPQGRRDVLLKATDEICKRRDSILSTKVSQANANYPLAELWEYLLINGGVIRPIGGVNQGQILNFRRFLAEVSKEVPTWIWYGSQLAGSIAIGLLATLLFCGLLLLVFAAFSSDDLFLAGGILLLLLLCSGLGSLYLYQKQIKARFQSCFWPLLERSYRPQRERLLEFFDAQSMPVRAFPILLDPKNAVNRFPGIKPAVSRAILCDSDLLLLAVTSRAL